jgi:hypothetical protein
MKLYTVAFVLSITISSCPKKKSKTLFSEECPLSSKLEWVIVEDGVETESQIHLLSELSAAAAADAAKINMMRSNTSGTKRFESELARTVNAKGNNKIYASQDVFDEYVKLRMQSCNLWYAAQTGLYADDEALIIQARNLFINIEKQLNELKETKKEYLLPSFPWYPPPPSAKYNLSEDGNYFKDCKKYGEISDRINRALDDNKYEKAYFSVPGGFAIVTKLEVTNNDGSSRNEPDRYDIDINSVRKSISLSDYISALFFGKVGYYRTIVFIITDNPIIYSPQPIPDTQMKSLIKSGADWLPEDFKQTKLTAFHKVTALIYEFQIKDNDTKPSFCDPSRLAAKTHLEMSKIITKLK